MAVSFNRLELVRQRTIGICQGTTAVGKVGTHRMTNYVVASGATAETLVIPLDPTQITTVQMSHHATDTPTVNVTATIPDADDLLDASVDWAEVYDGASTPYLATDDRALIGMQIVANPANGDIRISVFQTRRKR